MSTPLSLIVDFQPALPGVLQTLGSVSNQGVDIQLKILQALLSVLTYNTDAHGEILGNVGCDLAPELMTGSTALLQTARCPRISRVIHCGSYTPTSGHAHL